MSVPLHVFSDFDGTIAVPDTLGLLTQRVGGGEALYAEVGSLIWDGKLTVREAIVRCMESIRVPFADAVPVLRDGVRVDPGFAPLATWCRVRGVPLTVLSAGFTEIIELFVTPAEFPDVDVLANRFQPGSWRCVFRDDTAYGHDKAAPIRAARAAGQRTAFIGDGSSDREAAATADLVFARSGRTLAAHCRAQGIAHQEYDTLADVLRSLEVPVA